MGYNIEIHPAKKGMVATWTGYGGGAAMRLISHHYLCGKYDYLLSHGTQR